MTTKYTQEALLALVNQTPNTYVVANEGRLEVRMNAPLNTAEAVREMQPIHEFAGAIPPYGPLRSYQLDLPEPQVNPNEILHNMLDHIHDGNREELVGQMILMLGWLHQGGTMPNISKDTVTSTTLWIIPQND